MEWIGSNPELISLATSQVSLLDLDYRKSAGRSVSNPFIGSLIIIRLWLFARMGVKMTVFAIGGVRLPAGSRLPGFGLRLWAGSVKLVPSNKACSGLAVCSAKKAESKRGVFFSFRKLILPPSANAGRWAD